MIIGVNEKEEKRFLAIEDGVRESKQSWKEVLLGLEERGMVDMIFKLGMCAEKNWRKLNGFNFLGKVITGVKFKNGIEETTDKTTEAKSDPPLGPALVHRI